jgi:hypothetical protein
VLVKSLGCDPIGLQFTFWVCKLMGMDNIELHDAVVDGGAARREEVS